MALTLLGVVLTYASMGDEFFERMYSSDCMYLPSIFQEFFIEDHDVSGLKFNGQPNFFPDMAVYFPIYAATNSIVWSGIIYSLIQVGIIMFLGFKLFHTFLPRETAITSSSIFNVFLLFSISLGILNSSPLSFHLISNAFHTSAFVLTLWALIHFVKGGRGFNKSTIWLMVILLVGSFNDKLFYILGGVPLLITVILQQFSAFKKSALYVPLLLTSSLGLAYVSYRLVGALTGWAFIKQGYSISFESIISSLEVFIQVLKINFFTLQPETLIYWLAIVSLIGCAVSLRTGKHRRLNAFSIVFFMVVLFAPVFLGMLNNPTKFRYSIFVFYFMPIPLLINIAGRINVEALRKTDRIVIIVALCITAVIVSFSSMENIDRRITNYQPNSVINLDAIRLKTPGLLKGLSSYWQAKQTTYFSKQGVQVYACYYPKLSPNMYTGHNPVWYYGDEEPAEFNFIVMDNPNDTSKFKSMYANKTMEVISEKGTYILKTPKFRFKKGTRDLIFVD